MEVAANIETNVVALSYLLGDIVKDIVNSSHTRTKYQVWLHKSTVDFKRMNT